MSAGQGRADHCAKRKAGPRRSLSRVVPKPDIDLAEPHGLAVDGRKVFFETSVKDELDHVGAGTHTRFVVDKAKTFERLKAKAARFAALSG